MGADDAGCTESCAEEYGSSHGAVELAQHELEQPEPLIFASVLLALELDHGVIPCLVIVWTRLWKVTSVAQSRTVQDIVFFDLCETCLVRRYHS